MEPLAGAPARFGCRCDASSVEPAALLDAIHRRGFVVVDVGDLTGPELSATFNALLPTLEVAPIGWFDHQAGVFGAKTLNLETVGGEQFVAMGNVIDDATGAPLADYVPAVTDGVRMEDHSDGSWTPALEACLQEWHSDKRLCGFMEWHTDQLFVPVCPSVTALYCKRSGGASTAFASGVAGLRDLPPELHRQAVDAVCQYADTDTGHRYQQTDYDKVTGSAPIAGVQHRVTQRHPHTGELSLRFGGLGGLDTIVGMPPLDGQRIAWQIMRHATRTENAYFHRWKEGELIVWDQRLCFHSRVPYESDACNPREVWRVSFMPDEVR
jgi:alpha-ketoglutarate-dependent taurine dioxygenase